MKRFVTCICILAMSCNYFEKKKVVTEDIVLQELEFIDWNAVDTYPSFAVCDSISEKETLRQCFETTMLTHVNQYLSNQNIVVSQHLEDTMNLKFRVDSKGRVSVLETLIKPETQESIPNIDSLLKGSVSKLPKIFPATKRGQHVSTEFVLPVVIFIN